MAIPTIIPPPFWQPQGWTPNALRPAGGAAFTATGLFPIVPPNNDEFSWVNQGPAFLTLSPGRILLTDPATVAGDVNRLRLRVKPIPSAPYTVTLGFFSSRIVRQFLSYGLALYDTGTGKIVSLEFSGGTPGLAATKWNSPSAFLATYDTVNIDIYGLMYLRVRDDGTNRIMFFSSDGQNFIQFLSMLNNDFIVPDRVGFFANANNLVAPIYPVAINVVSYSQTQP